MDSSPDMPTMRTITYTRFPHRTCRASNAVDGIALSIEPQQLLKPSTEAEGDVVWIYVVREQAGALTVVPNHFDQPSSASTKDEEVSRVRILLQLLLHHERQRWKPTSHIGVAGRQPYANA